MIVLDYLSSCKFLRISSCSELMHENWAGHLIDFSLFDNGHPFLIGIALFLLCTISDCILSDSLTLAIIF